LTRLVCIHASLPFIYDFFQKKKKQEEEEEEEEERRNNSLSFVFYLYS
jgi:hypothetical protein